MLFPKVNYLKAQEFNYNDRQAATTLEIYNYVTKGYAIQVASGLDMKKGYFIWEKLTRSTNSADGRRTVKINALLIDSNFKVCAWILIYEKAGQTPAYFCIPTQASDEAIWNKAFTDLRDTKLSTDAYLAYTWALYNLVGQLTNDYDDICFSSHTSILMADGSYKYIYEIQENDSLASYDFLSDSKNTTTVSKLITHQDSEYSICRITLTDDRALFASALNNYNTNSISIEATLNHPVVTTKGIKRIGELTTDDRLLHYDLARNKFEDIKVAKIEKDFLKAGAVYNIKLKDQFLYIANHLVVMMK